MKDAGILSFPCELAIKIVGRNDAAFREAALGIIREHCAAVAEHDIRERLSREGAYLSLTVTVHVDTRAEADAVYRDLSAHEQVLIVL